MARSTRSTRRSPMPHRRSDSWAASAPTSTTTWTKWWRRHWRSIREWRECLVVTLPPDMPQQPLPSVRPAIQIWGGPEYTLNRVRGQYSDQIERSGHGDRITDLDRFASLGLNMLRYPLLWERVAPASPNARDWSWSDARLARMAALGIRPILGLLHHGSGPRYTSLLDPQ